MNDSKESPLRVDLPQEATSADVARAYQRARELGIKGVTIYC